MRTSETHTKSSVGFADLKIKDIVATNFRAAQVFEKYGIDYCCHGNRQLGEALQEKNLAVSEIHNQLNALEERGSDDSNKYSEWDLDFLAQFIVNTHHAYVKKSIPQIKEHLAKVINAHGKKYSYLAEVEAAFDSIAAELTSHMMKEENILFPLIHYLTETKKFNERPKSGGYGTIKNPIRRMEEEHSSAGEVLSTMKKLTNNYTLPKDACTTFKVTYEELKEFELDLHKHIHLENNILFPKAIELEEELLKL
ncbi:MAG: iron-sulfur cluster repair di-iron protein [Bacteroidetes bacterium]|nr:iron-sulfur cluster repair di-iron protein [Bacteroidota bacterium]